LQVVSRWVTGGGYALGAETAGGNLPPSRVGLFLPGRVVTSLLHFHLAALSRHGGCWWWQSSTRMTWQWCVVGGVVVVAGPGFIVGVVTAMAPVVVAVIRVVTVDAGRRRCRASFVTWCSCATGFSSANAKDGGGGVLTLGPGDVPSWEGGVGEERWWWWEGRKRRGNRFPDLGRRGPPNRKVGISSISSCH